MTEDTAMPRPNLPSLGLEGLGCGPGLPLGLAEGPTRCCPLGACGVSEQVTPQLSRAQGMCDHVWNSLLFRGKGPEVCRPRPEVAAWEGSLSWGLKGGFSPWRCCLPISEEIKREVRDWLRCACLCLWGVGGVVSSHTSTPLPHPGSAGQ